MVWMQAMVRLKPRRRGFHLITDEILAAIETAAPAGTRGLAGLRIGLLHIFIQHTSASIAINENADPDVPIDLEMAFNEIASERLPYIHTLEGADDMPAHVKAALIGTSLTVPVEEGKLCLGTWQGIYLCEHRDRAGPRRLVLTAQGEG